jgi:hypothetical protein
MRDNGQTFTAIDVCKVFIKHGMRAFPAAFTDHARWANAEAAKGGIEAGWDYIYWHAAQEASINKAESAAAAREAGDFYDDPLDFQSSDDELESVNHCDDWGTGEGRHHGRM